MTEDFEPGDEVFVKATIAGTPMNGEVRVAFDAADLADPARAQWVAVRDIRKSYPSEQSETAELERKVVEAACLWRTVTEDEELVGRIGSELAAAVDALKKALAPPSLEDEIKSAVGAYRSVYFDKDADALIGEILALVKARE